MSCYRTYIELGGGGVIERELAIKEHVIFCKFDVPIGKADFSTILANSAFVPALMTGSTQKIEIYIFLC